MRPVSVHAASSGGACRSSGTAGGAGGSVKI